MEHQKKQEDDRSQGVILGHFLRSKNLQLPSAASIQVHGRGLGEGKPSPGGYWAWGIDCIDALELFASCNRRNLNHLSPRGLVGFSNIVE